MSYARILKQFIPQGFQPVARYHFERWTGREERELPLAASWIRAGDVVVDVGANFGVYTHAFARRGATVHAFEPQPPCLSVLHAYATGRPKVHVYDVALGAAEGHATLHVPKVGGRPMRGAASIAHGAADEERVDVPVRSLDSYGLTDVALMKIDVEGAELGVIRGAERTIRASHPILLVEIEQRHHSGPIADAFAAITALGYRGAFLDPAGSLQPLERFDATVHQIADPAARPGGVYVFNFFFLPNDGSRAAPLTAKLLPASRAQR